jgi:peptidoglycan/xylan/chitin deacetylase (PgdA/CDA1 family)
MSSRRLLVLAHHKIGPWPSAGWESWYYVRRERFASQLERLLEGGWVPLDTAQFVRLLAAPEDAPERSFLVTFDDAYASLLDHAAPLLRDLEVPAVVFVPTAYVGASNTFDEGTEPAEVIASWRQLEELRNLGVAVGSHGVHHVGLSAVDRATRREELAVSKEQLERHLGDDVALFSYPYGDAPASEEIDAELEELGYLAAFGYGGGEVVLPVSDRFRIERLAIGADTGEQLAEA